MLSFRSVLTLLANFLASAAPDRIDRLRGSRRKSFVIVGLSSPRDTLVAEATVSRTDAFRVERKQNCDRHIAARVTRGTVIGGRVTRIDAATGTRACYVDGN